ncbi:hypothetical protein SANTM175S_10762 [Streptomyces antimycoticus]
MTTRVVAMSRRSRNGPSIASCRVSPSTPMGSEPTITSQPIWASWLPRHSLLKSERNQADTMLTMSLRK